MTSAPVQSELAVTYEVVAAARAALADVARLTPLVPCPELADLLGGPAHLKCENLQRTGSFKVRGAYVRIHRLDAAQRRAGVVTASAGNHAQGVALASQLAGVRATVFMPVGASLPKIAATEGYGARVRLIGHNVDEALVAARSYAQRSGSVFVHPFDHADVVAGQGTVGLEVLQQCPDVRTILVNAGGGGLLAGVAAAVKHHNPDVQVIGVQAAGAAAFAPALAAGHPVALDSVATMADGIAVGRVGDVPFGIVRQLADGVITVSEEALSQALLFCLETAKLVVEPAGVASVAALLDAPERFEPPVVAVLSGGNIDPLMLLRVLRHGMAGAGRFLRVSLRLPDLPGALARVLHTLAECDANVIDVEHSRIHAALDVSEAEVVLQLETRGPAHLRKVLAHLRASGHSPSRFGVGRVSPRRGLDPAVLTEDTERGQSRDDG